MHSRPHSPSDIIINGGSSILGEKKLIQGVTVYICLHSRNQARLYFLRDASWIAGSFSSKASNLKVSLARDGLASRELDGLQMAMLFKGPKGLFYFQSMWCKAWSEWCWIALGSFAFFVENKGK